MSSERYEYRVRWRREDRQGTSQIFQTEAGARAKVRRLVELEALKRGEEPETGIHSDGFGYADPEYFRRQFGDMPDLVKPPTLERRAVGEWLELVDS